MKKILIVDDSAILRKDLRKLFQTIKNIEVAGEAIDSAGALRQCEALKPDIMILDIELKNGNGIEVLTKVKKCSRSPIIIMFTNYSNSAFKKAAEHLGAGYFFDKTNDVEKLVSTLINLSSKL
jgi:DNA-binding NarL/FixJ family response regulator